jgi:hypothetical protein
VSNHISRKSVHQDSLCYGGWVDVTRSREAQRQIASCPECISLYDEQVKRDKARDGTLNEVVDLRVQVYGDPVETFVRIAEVWSGILGHEVQPTDVPLCLIGMKIVRTTQAPDYSDNSDDIEGYLDIFRQIVGDDMVTARSVTEYVEKKHDT